MEIAIKVKHLLNGLFWSDHTGCPLERAVMDTLHLTREEVDECVGFKRMRIKTTHYSHDEYNRDMFTDDQQESNLYKDEPERVVRTIKFNYPTEKEQITKL
jgi:hypothetical protein